MFRGSSIKLDMMTLDSISKFKKMACKYRSIGLRPAQIFNLSRQVSAITFSRNSKVLHSPTVMGAFINNKCNLSCDFCYFPWKQMTQRDMTPGEFQALLEHPLFRNIIRISLAGGEPLLHPHLFDIIKIARLKSIAVALVSNGTLIKQYTHQLITSGIASLMISHYDQIFEKIEPNLKHFIDKRNNAGIPLYTLLCKVISRENYHEMEELINKALQLKVEGINFNPFFTTNRAEATAKALFDDNNDIVAYIKTLRHAYRKAPIDITFPPLISRDGSKIKKCIFLYSMISVDVEGNIAPCCFIVPPHSKYGNIFKDTDVFNNEFYGGLRKAFQQQDLIHPILSSYCKYCYFAYATPLKVI